MAVSTTISINESTVFPLDIGIKLAEALISDDVLRIYQWVILAVTCLIVSVFGTVANIINIICFARQGFKESVNVNFVGLAVSDLGCLITLILMSVGYNPAFQTLDLHFDSVEIMYLSCGWPHIGFARVTCLITALITVERCLCITVPLKVKSLITPKRVVTIIACMYVVVIVSVAPVYYANRLVWTFSAERNRSMLKMVFTSDRDKVENISYAFNNTFVPFGAFMVITVCTGTLVVQLKKKSKWRSESQSVHQAQDMSNRDQKIARMVVVLSILFIVCYFPISTAFIAMVFSPALTLGGQNFNISIVMGGIGFLLEAVNSALNIVIYYRMSQKYREIFRQIFGMSK